MHLCMPIYTCTILRSLLKGLLETNTSNNFLFSLLLLFIDFAHPFYLVFQEFISVTVCNSHMGRHLAVKMLSRHLTINMKPVQAKACCLLLQLSLYLSLLRQSASGTGGCFLVSHGCTGCTG